MYYGNLNNPDLNFLHHKTLVNATFKYSEMIGSNLFKIFEHGDFVEINPLFYYDTVEVTDKTAVIRENNIIIKQNNNTEFTFTSTQRITNVQIYCQKVNSNYMIYILNEWCDGYHSIPVRITTSENEDIPLIPLETTTILTDDYLGDFNTYYTEPIETTDYITNQDGLILHITNETTIYVELTINEEKYCFKTGGESE